MMPIGELASAAGVTVRTVRHYHSVGLLPEPAKRPNGYREYGTRDLLRIRRLVALGLTLQLLEHTTSRELLAWYAAAGGTPDAALALARRFEALADVDPGDPAVAEVAAELAVLAGTVAPPHVAVDDAGQQLWDGYVRSLPPAQARCLELAAGATS